MIVIYWVSILIEGHIFFIFLLCAADLKLADVLSEKTVYTWGGQDKTVKRKVILISSSLVGALDSVTMKALTVRISSCLFNSDHIS